MHALSWCFEQGRAVLVLTLAACAPLGWAAPPASPRVLAGPEADAQCIAVLKQEVKARLHTLPAQEDLPKAWQQRVEAAFALSGEAYHQGMSEKDARALLDAAEITVATWPEAQRKAQAQRCEAEGRERLDQATALEKLVVRTAAQRWLQRERARPVS